jgi:hypothetical protein
MKMDAVIPGLPWLIPCELDMLGVKVPDLKPNPADPLANPAPVPDHASSDLPPTLPNDQPSDEPDGSPTPAHPPVPPDHPLGPRQTIASRDKRVS